MFNWKNRNVRINETIDYIAGGDNVFDKATLIAVLKTWRDSVAHANERARISDAMHQGMTGSDLAKKLRRATILLRTVVLRHDASKVQREVNGQGDVVVAARYLGIVQQCVNFTQIIPPWLEVAKAPGAATAKKEMVDQLTGRLRLRLNISSDWWLERLKDHVDALSPEQRKLYDAWQAAEADADALRTAHGLLKKIVYLPAPTDTDQTILDNVDWLKDGKTQVKRGRKGLAELQGGGELYVVGHGNFGNGIGGHHRHLGATKLAEALEGDDLPKNPAAPLWIYLWACWTATHTQRAWGGLGRREPYARRLARVLAKRGFENCFTVGFAGSAAKGEISQDYKLVEGELTKGRKKNLAECDYVVYEVTHGDYNRVAGEDWTTKCDPVWRFWEDYDIHVNKRQA
jgi:hypothetical protein